MNNRFRMVALAVVLTMGVAVAQSRERFQLFNSCQSMDLALGSLDSDATGIGLTEQSIQNVVESRLRSARLYDSNLFSDSYLYVNVNVIGLAFGIDLEYYKMVIDEASGLRGLAATWSRGLIGTHGRDASYILSSVSELMDLFLVEYLRVNEEAC